MKIAVHSVRQELTLNFLWFCLNVQYAALAPIVIPTQILLFVGGGQVGSAQQATLLGWLVTVASVVSLPSLENAGKDLGLWDASLSI